MTTARVTLPLDNLGCGGGEALAIERAIAKLPGVTEVYINPLTEMVYVVYDPALLSPVQVQIELDRLGYGVPPPVARRESTIATTQPAVRSWHSYRQAIAGGLGLAMIEQSVRPTAHRFTWAISLLVVVVLAGIATWIWSSTTAPQADTAPAATAAAGATQTNESGQVTIAATWKASGAQPSFNIAMNTHAVDLDGYDLEQLAVLRIDGGREVQPIGWEAPKGGHHRSGTLTFPATDADGRPLIDASTRTIELVIRDVAGVPERVLVWRQ